jgi:hypothetical protein
MWSTSDKLDKVDIQANYRHAMKKAMVFDALFEASFGARSGVSKAAILSRANNASGINPANPSSAQAVSGR